eukprot:TRINITY_DN5666_c0_g2_i2.p1 TRINITY_DN5666_c0_g2~~TRINITY_DN5666_c0_g2_i2.p1  ORF type:complete len:326 (-),score=70.57 TRINITY_DN5666_c0_g2_i2:12-908(-)
MAPQLWSCFGVVLVASLVELVICSLVAHIVPQPLSSAALLLLVLRIITAVFGAAHAWSSEGQAHFFDRSSYAMVLSQTITVALGTIHTYVVLLLGWNVNRGRLELKVFGLILGPLFSMFAEILVYFAGREGMNHMGDDDDYDGNYEGSVDVSPRSSMGEAAQPYRERPASELAAQGELCSCVICLDAFVNAEEAAAVVGELPCGHYFHPECIQKWLACSGQAGCPLRCPPAKRAEGSLPVAVAAARGESSVPVLLGRLGAAAGARSSIEADDKDGPSRTDAQAGPCLLSGWHAVTPSV